MTAAIDAMRRAFSDDRETPLRRLLGSSLFMPGRVGSTSGIKVVSTTPGDPAGIVAAFDEHGRPLGLCDGPTLTKIRTGAACGLATALLGSGQEAVLAMLGSGAMAADLVDAVGTVRHLKGILIWSREPGHAAALSDRFGGEVAATADEAVAAADIVCTATPATSPIFAAEALRPGTHVNAIGAFTPDMAELPAAALRSAFVVVDDRDAAAAEAGDLLQAGVEPDATLGDLLEDRATPPGPGSTTIFKSVGIASQDVAAAAAALKRAREMGIGVRL
jgi:ornithine cyclodeaminase